MHVVYQVKFGQALVGYFDLVQKIRNHSDDLAARGHDRVSDHPHEPDPATAEHHSNPLRRQPSAQFSSQHGVTRLGAQRRTAKNRHPPLP